VAHAARDIGGEVGVPDGRGEKKVNSSNLAAEFYVASQLYRLGYQALITYSNMKAIDIVVVHPDGRKASIDVKSLKNTTNWPFTPGHKAHDHFYVLVCYHNKYSDLTTSPEVYVVPSAEIGGLLEEWGGPAHSKQRCVGYPTIRKHPEYKDAWHMLFGPQAG